MPGLTDLNLAAPRACRPRRPGKSVNMNDQDILTRIQALVEQEDTLREQGDAALNPEDRERLQSVERDLDQCWDLLRQRRAKRAVGEDPDEASPRPEELVERYVQ